MSERVLIIGGGHAAGQCAQTLRRKGWSGDIIIAGEEQYPPYQRPPLSKAYLAGEMDAERLFLLPSASYQKQNIELRLGLRANTIERAGKQVRFDDHSVLDYDHLVLATGTRVRKLNCPGAELAGIGYLRSIADVDVLQKGFQQGASLVVIGAGYIGLEIAAVAAKRGLKVTVIEVADRVLSRVTSPTVSRFFEGLHKSHGVELRLETGLASFEGEGHVSAIKLLDGTTIACDMAVVGIGVLPNEELAANAGLEVNNGILVNEYTATSDDAIYAIGDCTRHPSHYFGAPLRLESVHNAIEQGKTAAMAICGAPAPYNQVPWFWSDQYNVKLQTVGICTGRYDQEVVRGDLSKNTFSVFYLKGTQLIAVDSINAPADHMISRKIIALNKAVNAADLANQQFDLKSCLQ